MAKNFHITYPVEDLDYFAYTVKKNGWAQVRVTWRGRDYEVYLVSLQGISDELEEQLETNESVCVVNTIVVKKLDLEIIRDTIESLVSSGEIRQLRPDAAA